MIVSWMLYATLVGLLASAAAYVLDRGARANRVPSRFIWLAAMTATVLSPFIGYAAQRMVNVASEGSVSVGPVSGSALSATLEQPGAVARLVGVLSAVAERIERPVTIVWAVLTLLLLSRIVYATVMLWRRRREWVAREIDGVQLFVTPDLGPAVVALPESRILVPEWLLQLEPAQLSAVLRHEREHDAAGDPRLLVAASMLTALFPWNATIWWQSRRLRLAVEMDCDARVLRHHPRVDQYGSLLLAIAQHPRTALYGAATLTESSSDLERRIHAMTSTPPSAPRIVGALCAVIAAGAIFVACAVPSPDVVAGPTRPELMAQGPQPLSADQTLMDFQVETPARPLPGSMPPKYPLQLRTANIGGVVVAKFVVDTTGMPRMSTFEIMKSDHDLFTQAVRASVSEFRFSPAEVGGHKVKQLVQMPFVFSLSTEERDSLQASLKMKRAGAPAPDVSTADDKTAPLVEFVPAKAGRKAMVITATRPERRPPADSVIEVPAMKKPDAPVARRAGRGSVQPAEKPRFALAKLRDTIEAEADPAGSPPPTYPNQLRAANIEGQVHASFVVRANGEVDMTTFRIVKSDHNLFAEAVRKSVPQMRFKPATINGARVDWVVEMPFIFSLSK